MCSIFGAAADRTSLALTQRERGREKEKQQGAHCCCIFQLIAFPSRKTATQWDIKGKAKPKQCYTYSYTVCMYVCLAVCVYVCVTSTHARLSSISSHNPSKQAAIHPISQPAMQLSIHPSIYPAIPLSRYPCSCPSIQACVSSSCRWPQLQCIMPRTYFRSRSLCRCKEFNMCFDCIVLHVALRLTLIVAAW